MSERAGDDFERILRDLARAPEPAAVPAALLHYRVHGKLGQGGMGSVLRAEDTKLRRSVALKRVALGAAADPNARTRLMREARAASALSHPNIVTVFAIEEVDEIAFIAMELVEGRPLSALVADGPLPLAEVLSIGAETADALEHAHAAGIIHRDVKPANVMVTPSRRVKVLDFGLATASGGSSQLVGAPLTAPGAVVGTAPYMSPEQLRGEELDARTDVFALGCVVYEMATGRRAFPADNIAMLVHEIATVDPPPPSSLVAGVPPELDALLARALAKDRTARVPTAGAMRDALRALAGAAERATAGAPSWATAAPARPGGERRQVTVLATRLVVPPDTDPEALAELVPEVSAVVDRAAQQFEGRVDLRAGEAFTVVFGDRVAHEDDAVRAARAAAAITAEIATIAGGWSVRHGIHTAVAVVGPSPSSILGDAPRVAAQLEGAAAAGETRVSGATERLLRRGFACEGVDGSGSFRIVHELAAPLARGHGRRSRLIGRASELGLLLDRWSQVREGDGQTVILVGEPGIGKSRLVDELTAAIAGDRDVELRCQGSAYHRNVALHAILELLRRQIKLGPRGAPDALSKLEWFCERRGVNLALTVPPLAQLLGVPLGTRYSPPAEQQGNLRRRMLDALASVILALAASDGALLVVEDAHWLDPTTLELLALISDRGAAAPLFLVVTTRPELRLGWPTRTHRSELPIRRLTRAESSELMAATCDGQLPSEIACQVLTNADGVPLFIEELTRDTFESRAAGIAKRGIDSQSIVIPSTLKESLTARLDRLGSAKEVAQLASALGREFDRDLLRAIADMDEGDLESKLARLVEAELLYPRDTSERRRYVFKHALIQEAAYQSLVTARRVDYHRRVARALEERFRDLADAQPELLAHHFTESRQAACAIPWWRRAGEQAIERSAHREAAEHLRRGLELLAGLPEDAARAKEELVLQMRLGHALSAIQGIGVPAVGAAYARAHELASGVDGSGAVFPSLFGLWLHHLLRGDLQRGRAIAEQLGAIADAAGDVDWIIESLRARGTIGLFVGDLDEAARHLERILPLYRREEHAGHASRYGFDPGSLARIWLAQIAWYRGDDARTEELRADAIALARDIRHPLTVALVLEFDAFVSYSQGAFRRAEESTTELCSLAADLGFPYWRAVGEMLHGWAVARQGDVAAGLEELERGSAARRSAGGGLAEAAFRALEAEVLALAGRVDDAIAATEEGLAAATEKSDRFFDVEMRLVRAPLLAARSPASAAECLGEAAKRAREQGAPRLLLRAARALARLAGHEAHAAALLEEALRALPSTDDRETREAAALIDAAREAASR
jgi:class 3 adenylate cyclase